MQQQTPVTVANTATAILASRSNRGSYILHNNSATVTVYLGSSTVTAANGMPLAPGEKIGVARATGDTMAVEAVYGITAASTAEVRISIGSA